MTLLALERERNALPLRRQAMQCGRRGLIPALGLGAKSISAVARTFDVHPAMIYRVIEG